MTTWDRTHRDNEIAWQFAPSDFIPPTLGNCCLILEDDPGNYSSELLLESDATGTDCLQPEEC